MDSDKKKILSSLLYPFVLILIIWGIKLYEISRHTSLSFLGTYPKQWEGLIGIITSPLVHENWSHVMANSGPLLVLGGVIFYFYRRIAWYVLGLSWFITGLWVWAFAREAYHIGASGVVYALVSFVFTSGVLRKDNRLLALSLLVVFLYGSLIWGIFPQLFPDKNISWESHLMGLIAGVVVAVYYRKTGPSRKVYEWEKEEEEEVPDWYIEETAPDQHPKESEPGNPGHSPPPEIKYHYKPGNHKD
ncbi:MAG: rhomboid family intramembrane serine protease [Bacteroidales bacterium]